MEIQRKLRNLAIYSRVFLLIIQYFGNIVIPDHDAHVFMYPKTSNNYTFIDKIIMHLLGGFVRWDSHYFMHIAKYGYTYENTLAFFPLYPFLVRLISLILYSVFPFASLDSILLVVFIGLNNILFILTTKLLFNLTTIVFNKGIAYRASVLFCFNPASVFFSAPYSECMFCYLTFYSILNCLLLYKKYSNPSYKTHYADVLYLVPIMLSTVVRSNGILNIGFLAYTCICIYQKYNVNCSFTIKLWFFVKCLFTIISLSTICLTMFIIFQIYCYKMFCTNFETKMPDNVIAYAEINSFILPGQFSKHNQSWCYDKIPLAYSHVQSFYWKVGFLKYYTIKQIPNFLLAIPTLYIVTRFCCQQIKYNFNTNIMNLFSFHTLFKKSGNILLGAQLNVFVIHAMFLSIFCALFIHIQVTTRMLCSATPLVYWACASYFKDARFSNFREVFNANNSLTQHLIKYYFLGYFVVGTVLFSNFLPWT